MKAKEAENLEMLTIETHYDKTRWLHFHGYYSNETGGIECRIGCYVPLDDVAEETSVSKRIETIENAMADCSNYTEYVNEAEAEAEIKSKIPISISEINGDLPDGEYIIHNVIFQY